MNRSRAQAAVMPESRPRPPDLTLMSDCPIIAHPPMPPRAPQVTLATPCPMHSRLPLPRVSVSSSTSVMVMSDSMSPTPARTSEKGRMIRSVSNVKGGRSKSHHAGRGRPPEMPTAATSTDSIAACFSSVESGATGVPWVTTSTPSGRFSEARASASLARWALVTAAACVLSTSTSRTVRSGAPSGASPFCVEFSPMPMSETTMIAASDEGTALVSLGRNAIIAIVSATSPSMIQSRLPSRNDIAPSGLSDLKLANWAIMMTIASPLTNPSMTGCGTMRMSLPRRRSPTTIWIRPQSTTAGKRYPMP